MLWGAVAADRCCGEQNLWISGAKNVKIIEKIARVARQMMTKTKQNPGFAPDDAKIEDPAKMTYFVQPTALSRQRQPRKAVLMTF